MFKDLNASELWACANLRWSLGIGDPTVAGWVTVGSYGLCILLAALILRREAPATERLFWGVILVMMVLLGINKQLDLQTLLTAAGRCIARDHGWYRERRAFQADFIRALLAATAILLSIGLWLLRRHLRRNGLALLGLAFVAGFVAIRAISFHHFDAFINSRTLLNLRFNFVLENAGLLLIAVNAVALLRRPPARG